MTAVACLLRQADLLAEVRDQAAAEMSAFDAGLAERSRRRAPWPAQELAEILVDADTVARVLGSGAADQAQRAASTRAQAILAGHPDLPAGRVRAAVAAAGALVRMSCLAAALGTPTHRERIRRLAGELRSAPAGSGPPVDLAHPSPLRAHVRTAVLARAAAAARTARLAGSCAPPRYARPAHRERIDELTARLVATACVPGASGAPLEAPRDPRLLGWLRSVVGGDRLYEYGVEEAAARRWLGGDIYGHRHPRPAPDFLAGLDVRALPPRLVAPFLRRMSLTRPRPTAAELTPAALADEAAPVSAAERDPAAPAWADTGAVPVPPLPALIEIPRVVHGIWLGRPMPQSSVFWQRYGDLARGYAGELDVVLWTDLSRDRLDTPAAARLLGWARAHGIHVVDAAEIFHATAPMLLHSQYALEMCRQLPAGFAGASDHLRVEIAYRFGGLYADGDMVFAPTGIPELLDRVAASPCGFALNAVGRLAVSNDLIAAPAGHPALALWREIGRLNYYRPVGDLYGGTARVLADPRRSGAAWTWTVTPARSGRIQHHLLRRLGITGADLTRVQPTITFTNELSWVPPATGEPPVPHPDGADVLPVLQRTIAYLRWQLLARGGDLHLSAVSPIIAGLPEPDLAWSALIAALRPLGRDLPEIRSATVARRYDNHVVRQVTLPPAARALLRPASGDDWLGAGHDGGRRQVWFLGEQVMPARLAGPPRRPAAVAAAGPVDTRWRPR
ncbi:hypothetical protein ACN27F_02750 [Solwaraspora sp. WMMB335]|uniref:hypothetical protein n=1 Tax=Solwaraspora sp. WMMB335 TaxID=3404118 RepID=UPI003B95F092